MSISEIQNRAGLLFTSSWFQYQQYTLVFNSSQDFLTKVLPCSYFEVRKAMTYVVQNGTFFFIILTITNILKVQDCQQNVFLTGFKFNICSMLSKFYDSKIKIYQMRPLRVKSMVFRQVCANLQVAQLLTLLAFCRQVTLCSSLMI